MIKPEIEKLLLSIFKQLYEKGKENIPKNLSKIITETFPSYLDKDLDLIDSKERNSIINVLKNCQKELDKLKLLTKKQNSDLNILIQQINQRKSVKEQIEGNGSDHINETAFVKNIGGKLIDDTEFSESDYVNLKGSKGHFYIHTHPWGGYSFFGSGKIPDYFHIPSIPDLVIDCDRLIKQPNAKSVIVAVINGKVTGYFYYSPSYNHRFIELLKLNKINPNRINNFGSNIRNYISDRLYYFWYKRKLKNLGISYTYKTMAMPGYSWDDKDKIFKPKK